MFLPLLNSSIFSRILMKTAVVGLFSKMDTLFTILHERDYSGGVKYCEVHCLVVDLYCGSKVFILSLHNTGHDNKIFGKKFI